MFTLAEAAERGLTRAALRWEERRGRWRRIDYAVYAEGADEPDALDLARARVLAARGVASGRLAALLHELDGVDEPDGRSLRQRVIPPQRVVVVNGIRCADGLQTLVDLAADLDDVQWSRRSSRLAKAVHDDRRPRGHPALGSGVHALQECAV